MNISVTIFDIGQQPLAQHPVILRQNGNEISRAVTDANGVAVFATDITALENLSVRSALQP